MTFSLAASKYRNISLVHFAAFSFFQILWSNGHPLFHVYVNTVHNKKYRYCICPIVASGDVCFDKTSGFWLVHSVPNFPPHPASGYSYPQSGTVFGQTFLCVTYQYSSLNDIGRQYCICLNCNVYTLTCAF